MKTIKRDLTVDELVMQICEVTDMCQDLYTETKWYGIDFFDKVEDTNTEDSDLQELQSCQLREVCKDGVVYHDKVQMCGFYKYNNSENYTWFCLNE